jgi:hypothetical protein
LPDLLSDRQERDFDSSDCIGSCRYNYHTITTKTGPILQGVICYGQPL